MVPRPLIKVYESDRLRFHIEPRDTKVYLHTEILIKRPDREGVIEAHDVLQELGHRFGELFTYSVDRISARLCERNGFFPTEVNIPAHWDSRVMLPEWWWSNGRAMGMIEQGRRAHEALGELGGGEDHETDGHNFAVGIFLERYWLGQKVYAANEYNLWASQHGYVPVTILDNNRIQFDAHVVEVPSCL